MEFVVSAALVSMIAPWCSLGGVVLAGGLLLVTRYASAAVAHRVTAACALSLAAASLGLALIAPAAAIGLSVLALLSAAAWAAGSARAKRVAATALQPGLIWGAALLLFLVAMRVMSLQPVPDEKFVRDPGTDVRHELIHGMRASTDAGRPIQLLRYQEYPQLKQLEREFLSDRVYEHEVIRLAGPNLACNCHGWVFTGGQFGVRGSEVYSLLAGNGYRPVAKPQPGDVIIYHNMRGEATHTGVVRIVDENRLVIVESKWGPLGVYLHRPKSQPFGQEFVYYRSPRQGHLIKLDPGTSDEQQRPALNTARDGVLRPGPMGVKSPKVRSRQS